MVPADRALAADAPPVTVTWTGRPQAADPVTITSRKPPVRAVAAMGPCTHAAPPLSARQLQPLAPGPYRPVTGVEPGGSEMLAVSSAVAAGPPSATPKATAATCWKPHGPSTVTWAVT